MKKESAKFENSDILEGMSSISALIKSIERDTTDRQIMRILFDENKIKNKHREYTFLKATALELGYALELTTADHIDQLTIGSSHGGIIALCTQRTLPFLTDEVIKDNGVYFILEGVEDPYNFGYAVRSLYAAGVNGVILGERNWMGASGVVARSSAGVSELMEMYVAKDICDAIEIFRQKGYTVVCAGIRDSESLFESDLSTPILVILGGEKRGISRNVLDKADRIVRIDYGSEFGGSLSTSAATAVFAFEILRYNNLKK